MAITWVELTESAPLPRASRKGSDVPTIIIRRCGRFSQIMLNPSLTSRLGITRISFIKISISDDGQYVALSKLINGRHQTGKPSPQSVVIFDALGDALRAVGYELVTPPARALIVESESTDSGMCVFRLADVARPATVTLEISSATAGGPEGCCEKAPFCDCPGHSFTTKTITVEAEPPSSFVDAVERSHGTSEIEFPVVGNPTTEAEQVTDGIVHAVTDPLQDLKDAMTAMDQVLAQDSEADRTLDAHGMAHVTEPVNPETCCPSYPFCDCLPREMPKPADLTVEPTAPDVAESATEPTAPVATETSAPAPATQADPPYFNFKPCHRMPHGEPFEDWLTRMLLHVPALPQDWQMAPRIFEQIVGEVFAGSSPEKAAKNLGIHVRRVYQAWESARSLARGADGFNAGEQVLFRRRLRLRLAEAAESGR